MYGFLNVFVASALVYAGEKAATAVAALEESDRQAFAFEDDAISWRGRRIKAEQIEDHSPASMLVRLTSLTLKRFTHPLCQCSNFDES